MFRACFCLSLRYARFCRHAAAIAITPLREVAITLSCATDAFFFSPFADFRRFFTRAAVATIFIDIISPPHIIRRSRAAAAFMPRHDGAMLLLLFFR